MICYFESNAQQEFDDAIEYYDGINQQLGNDFVEAVERLISRILSFPKACPEVLNSIRRCRLKRFPYGLVYRLGKDAIEILAVMHFSREPNYWVDRS
jgi:plasmid stabilization system protein ParE